MNERSFTPVVMSDTVNLPKLENASLAILDSAYILFTSQGYAATSMRQIAEKAGLALGSIYNHFSSKENIFEVIVQTRHPIYLVLPLLKEAHGDTMDDFIRSAAHSMVDELGHHPEFFNLMLIELVEFKGKHAQLLLEKIYPDLIFLAERMVVFQDDLKPIPVPLFMRAFIGMFFSYFITDILLKNLVLPEQTKNALDIFIEIFLNGVKRPVQDPSGQTGKLITTETL